MDFVDPITQGVALGCAARHEPCAAQVAAAPARRHPLQGLVGRTENKRRMCTFNGNDKDTAATLFSVARSAPRTTNERQQQTQHPTFNNQHPTFQGTEAAGRAGGKAPDLTRFARRVLDCGNSGGGLCHVRQNSNGRSREAPRRRSGVARLNDDDPSTSSGQVTTTI
jgi:hypothetical protein